MTLDNEAEATPIAAADLRRDLARAQRRRKLVALALVAPLALFLLFTFLAPIGEMLRRAVVDPELAEAWPRVTVAIGRWTGEGVPDEALFAALGQDLRDSFRNQAIAGPARRLNYALPNGRTLVTSSARRLARMEADPPSWRDSLIAAHPDWGAPATWAAIRQASGPVTDFYMLAALDMRRTADGISAVEPDRRLYLDVLARTFGIAGSVTLICVLLGFPLAYLLAHTPAAVARVLLVLVLLPFWTSLLVRTTAWIVLLQEQGLVNDALIGLGLVDQPLRLVFNRVGVLVAMVHVLLPFMVLPLYATLRTIPPSLMRAALSLGAHPVTAFRRVYLPQAVPGLAAGALLVFILALGYYITPALVGGAEDQMVAYFVAFYTTNTVNWGLASALGAVLLAATAALYLVYARLAGTTRMSLG